MFKLAQQIVINRIRSTEKAKTQISVKKWHRNRLESMHTLRGSLPCGFLAAPIRRIFLCVYSIRSNLNTLQNVIIVRYIGTILIKFRYDLHYVITVRADIYFCIMTTILDWIQGNRNIMKIKANISVRLAKQHNAHGIISMEKPQFIKLTMKIKKEMKKKKKSTNPTAVEKKCSVLKL